MTGSPGIGPSSSAAGAPRGAPENTIAAFDRAVELGTDYIEFDVQMTRDGRLVILHDDTLDRTARGPERNCTGLVGEKSLEQLRTCDVGSWFNEEYPGRAREEYEGLEIPTLEQVFGRYGGRTGLYIDLRRPEAAPEMDEKLLRLMNEYGLRNPTGPGPRPIIISFDRDRLRHIHDLDPSLSLVQLLSGRQSEGPAQDFLEGTEEYASGVGPPAGRVDAALVEEAHALGLVVFPYTVNDRAEMRRLIEAGVDGIGTDFPDRLAEVRRHCVTGSETPPLVPPNCF